MSMARTAWASVRHLTLGFCQTIAGTVTRVVLWDTTVADTRDPLDAGDTLPISMRQTPRY